MKLYAALPLLICLPAAALAQTYSAKSEAEYTPGKMTVSNVEYRFEQMLSGPVNFTTQLTYLYKIEQTLNTVPGQEVGDSDTTVTAYDPAKDRKLWSIHGWADEVQSLGKYFSVRLRMTGDCQTSYRLFGVNGGQYLATYSFANSRTKAPVVLRSDAFQPDGFRFMAYLDGYWPCHGIGAPDRAAVDGLTYAGVITYASPLRTIQKFAVYYDEKAYADPSSDPSSIELTYQGKTVKFGDEKSPAEYEYWWRKAGAKPEADTQAAKIYSGITAKLVWGGGNADAIEIPLENDRLVARKAKLGKYFKKIVEIPEKDWASF